MVQVRSVEHGQFLHGNFNTVFVRQFIPCLFAFWVWRTAVNTRVVECCRKVYFFVFYCLEGGR